MVISLGAGQAGEIAGNVVVEGEFAILHQQEDAAGEELLADRADAVAHIGPGVESTGRAVPCRKLSRRRFCRPGRWRWRHSGRRSRQALAAISSIFAGGFASGGHGERSLGQSAVSHLRAG